MWQSASVLVGQPLRKLSLGIERLQQKKFRNFDKFIMFQQTIFLIRNLFNLNRLCLRADLKNSMKKISRKFKSSVLFIPIIYRILRCSINPKQLPHKILFLMIKIDYSNVFIFYPIKHIISRHKYVPII